MKDNRTASEIINDIGIILNERQEKKLPTFYTISIEQYGKSTPVAEKEEGYDNFKEQILKYMTDYKLSGITVQLFSGKSRRVKIPFQVFKVGINKQNPTVMLSGTKEGISEVEQMDNGISVHRYYDEKFELQMRIMRTEMEKQNLMEQVSRLTEKYEDKLKDQEKTTLQKIKDLEQEIQELQNDIDEKERELNRMEKEKHNSLGNVALGSVGSHLLEKFVGSKAGFSLLEGILGKESLEGLKGTLSGANNGTETPQKDTARIITQPTETTNSKDPRIVALAYIQKIGQSSEDITLKLLYEVAEMIEKNGDELRIIYTVVQQLKAKRNKEKTEIKTDIKSTTNENEKNKTDGEDNNEKSAQDDKTNNT